MKKLVTFLCIFLMSTSAVAMSVNDAIECVKENINCPDDEAGRAEVFNLAMGHVLLIVSTKDLSLDEKQYALYLSSQATSFLILPVLGLSDRQLKLRVYDVVMAKALKIFGSIHSTPGERQEANGMTAQANRILLSIN